MATTLAALVARLNSEIKIDKNNKIWSEDDKEQFINDAYFQVQKDMSFKLRANQASLTFSTAAGTQEYALPSNFITARLVTYNGEPLDKTEYEDLKEQNQGNAQGTPYEYYIYGDNIGLNSIPDAVGTVILYYRKRLPTLTDSQNTVLVTDFDLAIIKYAAYLLWSTPRGNRDTAQEKVTDYKQAIDTLTLAYIYQDTADLTYRQQRSHRGMSFRSPRSL